MEIFFKWSLNYETIGSVDILRPSPQTRMSIREKAEAHLRDKYYPGTYTDRQTCNEILQHVFKFYETELERVVQLVATSRWVGELLFQYDESGRVSQAYKRNELSKSDHHYWGSIGAVHRQSIDLICEKIASVGEIDKISVLWQTQIPDFEIALVCAEKCVEYSEKSNYTQIVVPNATSITIHPPNSDPYFEHQISDSVNKHISNYFRQNHKEVTARAEYLEATFDPFDHQYHASILNDAMREAIGLKYNQYQAIITLVPARFPPPQSYKNMPMCMKEDLIAGISEELELPTAVVELVLNSLVMDTSTPRKVWNSRQQNRINKQPFLQFVSKGRIVLMWSNRKVGDFLTLLDSDITFNKPQQGWTQPALVAAVTDISNAAGKWFERSATMQLEQVGFKGCKIKTTTFSQFPEVNFDCGEIDFLAYHPATNCLAIFEFKMFETGFDARGVRQVRSSFLEGKDAYTKVFAKKINWITENIEFVEKFLQDKYHLRIAAETKLLSSAFITFYPSLMNLFFAYPPCKSLVEFIDDFKIKGEWPY